MKQARIYFHDGKLFIVVLQHERMFTRFFYAARFCNRFFSNEAGRSSPGQPIPAFEFIFIGMQYQSPAYEVDRVSGGDIEKISDEIMCRCASHIGSLCNRTLIR